MKQLNTATELLAYLDDFSIPFSLNEEHAQVLLDYMEGSAYGLHVDEKGQLYWVDLEKKSPWTRLHSLPVNGTMNSS